MVAEARVVVEREGARAVVASVVATVVVVTVVARVEAAREGVRAARAVRAARGGREEWETQRAVAQSRGVASSTNVGTPPTFRTLHPQIPVPYFFPPSGTKFRKAE